MGLLKKAIIGSTSLVGKGITKGAKYITKKTVENCKDNFLMNPESKVLDYASRIMGKIQGKNNDSSSNGIIANKEKKHEKENLSEEEYRNILREHEITQNGVNDEYDFPEIDPLKSGCISIRNAIKVIYLYMNADQKIYSAEEEKFEMMAIELMPNFYKYGREIIKECNNKLKRINYNRYFLELVNLIIETTKEKYLKEEKTISFKHLIWNLIAIGYSDDTYDEIEHNLLVCLCEGIFLDKSILLEMENTVLTIFDLDKEIEWIKNNKGKTQEEIQEETLILDELNKRRRNVMNSITLLLDL